MAQTMRAAKRTVKKAAAATGRMTRKAAQGLVKAVAGAKETVQKKIRQRRRKQVLKAALASTHEILRGAGKAAATAGATAVVALTVEKMVAARRKPRT